MSLSRLLKFMPAATVTVALATSSAPTLVMAASADGRKPVILDSQGGINDGQSGTVLQTAPLSRDRIVEAQPMASPTELAPNSSTPIVVAPYIQYPIGGAPPQPQPQPRPVIHSR
ncbi:hypothetical protein AAGS40_04865 [Paraburkholderia sp. PREW-6R]|uniref:hypothetical protein n=1 Tax=Paraburkholderia sp. PREW-6R TaxID=3141544 RepID=UPI0031F4BE55